MIKVKQYGQCDVVLRFMNVGLECTEVISSMKWPKHVTSLFPSFFRENLVRVYVKSC